MKCDICNKNDATLHLHQVLDGKAREINVCQECAETNGFNLQSPMAMTDFLFGLSQQDRQSVLADEKICYSCGMRWSDFRQKSLLGCEECYSAFKDEFDSYLKTIHAGVVHVGKIPARERLGAVLGVLQSKLKAAIELQDFEQAAALRDEIRDIKAGASIAVKDSGEVSV